MLITECVKVMLDGAQPSDVTVDSSSNAPGDLPSDSQKPKGWSPADTDESPKLIFKINDEDDTSQLYSITFDETNVESVIVKIKQDTTVIDKIPVSNTIFYFDHL